MGDISANISRYEVACECGCGSDSIDHETVMVVQGVCDHFAAVMGLGKVILNIKSGHRCDGHNFQVGGGYKSQHLKARAMDISIRYVNPIDIHDYLLLHYPNKYGIGNYDTFTHIDTRTGKPARWNG